ncbi:acyl carrier protein [Micromonospora halophytica]|uniref:Act minimal PKS acyl carrier protein n=1 Tax=Micromonospora halophytica TaxID=47864 RepID=A0A1C5IJU5_9ACTN|nr:acyl carrier protein [Micromonospora halophytica]SCG58535.1 act minimal PKS acyl carrier protein [Micromonospora halophytica]
MNEFTVDDLTTILRECAGEDDESALDGDILDVEFGSLGYDSIAMMETAGRIKIDYGVVLADDVVLSAGTPRELVRLVNLTMVESS